jgi:uncharacterized protein YbjT (DUF2867 family)
MKYVITGGAGHISKPVAEKLLAKGYEVTVIGRNANNVAELVAKGAKAAIGSVEDVSFLAKAFAGADAVYTMIPPNMAATDWKGWIAQIGKNYAQAIKANGIKYVVNLSSIGAHMAEGCGPVSGLHKAENALNELNEVNIRHLRPAYFYPNLFSNLSLIKNLGIVGSNFGEPELNLLFSDTGDIAEVAAEELLALNFMGHSIRYTASDEKTSDEVAKILGTAIGKPELQWVVFTDEQALSGAIQAGLPEEVAKNYVEMGGAIRSGKMMEDYFKYRPATLGKTKLKDFAKVFAAVYNSQEAVAVH